MCHLPTIKFLFCNNSKFFNIENNKICLLSTFSLKLSYSKNGLPLTDFVYSSGILISVNVAGLGGAELICFHVPFTIHFDWLIGGN